MKTYTRFEVIDLIIKKLNCEDYCRNINCGTVTDYVSILLRNGFSEEEINSVSIGTESPYLKIRLGVDITDGIKAEMSKCCGFYPAIIEIV